MSKSTPLPPLSALRAFEAVARHLSFSKAADELSVTRGAISHQIKALEDYLKINLFYRRTAGLELTQAGAALAPGVIRGFREIHSAVDSFVEHDLGGLLTVSATPSFAALWLVLRLTRFHALHPEIDIRLDANAELVDFTRDDVDIAIRYGPGGYEALKSELLFEHCVTPLCSPGVLEQKPVRSPDDLGKHTLLHDEWRTMAAGMPTWGMWLKAAGATSVDPTRGLRFNDSNLALQAALSGQGVALLDEALARQHLREGHLVRPFDVGIAGPGRFAFWIVGPERTWRKPRIRSFREWLLGEIRAGDEPLGEASHV